MIAKRDKEKQKEKREERLKLAKTGKAVGLIVAGSNGIPYLGNKILKTKTQHHNRVLGPAALAGLGITGVSSYAHHKLKKKLKEDQGDDSEKK